MKAIYVSDDGKFFTDPEECRAYELSQNGYEVEVFEEYLINDSDLHHFKHFATLFPNKQKCQHFVADYIHSICEDLEDHRDYKITVRHKNKSNTFSLLELIEEVPAHYKISTNVFDKLIY